MKITTPILLTIITVVEMLALKQVFGSILLWLCYGLYKANDE